MWEPSMLCAASLSLLRRQLLHCKVPITCDTLASLQQDEPCIAKHMHLKLSLELHYNPCPKNQVVLHIHAKVHKSALDVPECE